MDEQEQAKQALMEMFRRDRVEAAIHPRRNPRWSLGPLTLPWLLAIAIIVFILGPSAFLIIYPRFGPVDTMTSFCTAEGDGEYATAYVLLSKRAQQRLSLEAFTQASHNANLASCAVNHGIPIIFGETQARLDATFEFNDSSRVDGAMSFVREHGEWRVDAMTPDVFHLTSYAAPE